MKGGKPVKTIKRYCKTCKKETECEGTTCTECLMDYRTEMKERYTKNVN